MPGGKRLGGLYYKSAPGGPAYWQLQYVAEVLSVFTILVGGEGGGKGRQYLFQLMNDSQTLTSSTHRLFIIYSDNDVIQYL
jgi:hypothetical protein